MFTPDLYTDMLNRLERVVKETVTPDGDISQDLSRDWNQVRRDTRCNTEKNLAVLEERVLDVQAKFSEAKHRLATLESERDSLMKEFQKLVDDDCVKSKMVKKIQKEIRDHKFSIQKAQSKSHPKQKDKDTLNNQMTELRLFKNVTGITWVMEVPDNIVAGMISNTNPVHLTPFEFDLHKVSRAHIEEELWKLIWESSTQDLSDKENVNSNA